MVEPNADVGSRLDLTLTFDQISAQNPLDGSVQPVLVDVAENRGLDFQYYNDDATGNLHLPETFGGGMACLDFDLDGFTDVWLPNGSQLQGNDPATKYNDALFWNQSGQFHDIAKLARIESLTYSHGCSYGDVNADGFLDVVVANFGSCLVFINQGDGTFLQQTEDSILSAKSWWSVVAIADLDHDQLPDIFCVPYVDWEIGDPLGSDVNGRVYAGPHEFDPLPIAAFKNLGDGGWQNRTSSWGLNQNAKGLAVSVVDMDNDLRPEIFVANDTEANFLFTTTSALLFNAKLTNASRTTTSHSSTNHSSVWNSNSVPETPEDSAQPLWQEIAELSGTAACFSGEDGASMSATVADFDNNGLPDVLVTNYFGRCNSLYANHGGLNFRDITSASRMDIAGKEYLSFGVCPIDFDLDGDWDMVIANGHVLGPNATNYKQNAQLMLNVDGSFVDITENAGPYFQLPTLGRSVGTMDYDNDGDTDVVVTHVDRPVSLLENQSETRGNWISLEVDDWRHFPLAGGRIEISVDQNRIATLPFQIGGSYLSDSQRQWTTGLSSELAGKSGETVEVQIAVFWADGSTDHWQGVKSNRRYRLLPNRIQTLD